ncbi:MAG: MFS transporter [Deltaproteobacteria bacterium]|jgi:MFS family permease|nr:MFS transporter [Deltaproteobacteria bacterium]
MYHGWKIVGVAFMAHFIAVGFVMYSYGVLFKALAADFGGSRLGVASGLTVMQIAMSLFAPLLGRPLDRGSIRRVMMAGAISTAVGFLLASQMTALWQWYLLLVTLIGLGTASLGSLAANTLVARWFVRRRGMALGIAGMGVSASGAVMAPIASILMGSVGWRGAFLVYASTLLFVMLPVLWAFVRTPEQLGLAGHAEIVGGEADEAVSTAPLPAASGVRMSRVSPLRQRNFWIITLTMGLNFGVNAAVATHIIPHGTDLGIPSTDVAFSISLLGLMSTLGKPFFGRMADRIDRRIVYSIAASFQMAGVALLGSAQNQASLLLAGALFGLGLGGMIPIWGSTVGAGFGRLAFARVSGLTLIWMLPIQAVPNPLAGHLFDRLGSYDLAFQVMFGHLAVSVLVFLFLRLPKVEPGR